MIKKGLLFLVLLFTLGLVIAANVSAAESEKVDLDSEKAFEDPLTGELIQPFKILEDGTVELISEEDYLAQIENQLAASATPEEFSSTELLVNKNKDTDIGVYNYYEYWRFARTRDRYVSISNRVKASGDIVCTTPTCSAQISVSATTTHNFSTTLGAERSAIIAGAGYTWSSSKTNSSTFTFSGLKRGDAGYIGFGPNHWMVHGNLSLYGSQGVGFIYSKPAWGSYPKVLSNGEADGTYYFVYTKRA